MIRFSFAGLDTDDLATLYDLATEVMAYRQANSVQRTLADGVAAVEEISQFVDDITDALDTRTE